MSKKKKKKKNAKANQNKRPQNDAPKSSENIEETSPLESEAIEAENATAADMPETEAEKTTADTEKVEPEAEEEAKAEEAEAKADEKEEEESEELVIPAAPIPYDPDFSEEDCSLSVKELSEDDIVTPEEEGGKKKKKKKKMSRLENIIQIVILCICAGVAVYCLFMLGQNIWGKIRGEQIYSNTEFFNFVLDDTPADTPTLSKLRADTPLLTLFDRIDAGESAVIEESTGKYDAQLEQMRASLSALKAKNDDIYGWIYIEGTNINHPVVRGYDNDYYLDHAYTGKEFLTIGSIFADCTTKDLISDNFNTVLYGHNVVSTGQSSMFHDIQVKIINNEEFFRTCKIYIYTMDGVFVYKPVSVYDTVSDYQYFRTSFAGESDFLAFAKEMVSNSHFYTGEPFNSGDTMLTLSTCTNGATDGRYALHAKLVEVVK